MTQSPAASATTDAPPEGATRLTIDGPVAHILFDRPHARNAMTWAMYEGLVSACEQAEADPSVRVVVVRGAGGKAFVAGTDIGQFDDFGSGADGIDYEARVARYVSALAQLTKPSVAVIEGWAVGGGLALASSCDFRIAARGAKFGVPIARTVGNCLSIANVRALSAMFGGAMLRRMLLLADMIEADELTSNGYLLSVVAPEELDSVVAELAGRLAENAPITLSATKQMLNRLAGTENPPDHDLVEWVYGSQDFREGITAFGEKRKPTWQGR